MQLYAYITPEIPKHAGYLKIGETTGNVDVRIKRQGHEHNVRNEKVWEDHVYSDRIKIDKLFHRYLKGKGFHVQQFDDTGQDSEWVKCTVAELEKAFADFKEQFYQDEKERQAIGNEFYLEIRNWFYWASHSLPDPEIALRLIVRLLFCYFIREKGLIPENLFDERFVKEHTKDNEYRYYNAILRNLFFLCLNTSMKERGDIEHKNLMKKVSPLKEQFDKVPFLNGGIFNEHKGDEIPLNDDYFFSDARLRHLEELGGDYKVAGILRILSQYYYKLTLDDLLDREKYAQTIDPEFIGKVFESLLACIEADCKETRRKVTGSYYTPREIVDYMVEESLTAYLNSPPVEGAGSYSAYETTPPLRGSPPKEGNDLLQCKILDPACGSGAFPCGVMNAIMRRLDPDRTLDRSARYRRKLEIIRKVIYGVDIQPMAVQITQLRLFLSLIQDIVPDKRKDNFGIDPLPNLETRFVCADALIGLKKKEKNGQRKLEMPIVQGTIKQLQETRNRYFMSSSIQEKKQLREYDESLRHTLGLAMEDAGDLTHDVAEKVVAWNPYNQSQSSPFFDSVWMFGVKQFDIVIGNPPYIFARNSKSKGMTDEKKAYYYEHYTLSEYQINLYPLFMEKGTDLLKANGMLCFITPNNWLTLNTNKKLRQFVLKQSSIHIINFYKRVFKSADVDSAIMSYKKSDKNTTKEKIKLAEWEQRYALVAIVEKKKILNGQCCVINIEAFKNAETYNLLEKIESHGIPLSEISDVKAGLQAYETGLGQPKQTEEMKINRVYHSKTDGEGYIKYLDGIDVCRYSLGWSGEFLKYGKHLAAPRTNFALFSTPRILVRQIPSSPPYCINACFTGETLLNDRNSMNIINIKVLPLYLLGILNSRVISYWFVHKFGKLQRGTFPQFKVNELAQFPIPDISAKQQRPIIALVDKILSAKKKDPSANTTKLEQQIDSLVYELYGLTQEEMMTIAEGEYK